MYLNWIARQRPRPWLAAATLTACLAAACPAVAAAAGTAAAVAQRPLNCGAPDYFISATPLRRMRWLTASRRCSAAESTEAARP